MIRNNNVCLARADIVTLRSHVLTYINIFLGYFCKCIYNMYRRYRLVVNKSSNVSRHCV